MDGAIPNRFRVGELDIDLQERSAGGHVLTEQDCALLIALVSRDQGVVSKEDLYREVWGYRSMPRGRALDFAVRRLREKIEPGSTKPVYLTTERGRGFRLKWTRTVGPTRDQPSVGVPLARTVWVGVRAAVERLGAKLGARPRLLTLHGPAGVGKTRLLVEAVSEDEPPLWIHVSAEPDPRALLNTLCTVLGAVSVPLTGEVGALCEAMVAELAGRGDSRLIVFDGAQEHLALLGMLLPTLLARTEIRVVLTSRVRLRIPEEEVLEVAPLDEGATLALLAQRVEVAVGHDRTRTEELRCLLPLIDGLPLMVELVAPRLRMLTPAQLLGRVRAGPGLLGPMVLEGVARLPPPQQTALQALAAFPYGVTLDVAEVLLAPFGDPLATLGALLDHSMVVRTQPNKGLPRFRVLWAVAKLVQEADPGQVVSAVVAEQAARWAGSDASRAVHRPGGGDLRRVLRGEFGQAEVWVHALERAENPDAACELALAFAHLMSWEGLHRAAIGLLCSLKAHTRLLSLAAEVGVRLQDAEAVDQMLKGAGDAASGAGDEARQTLAEMTVLLARDQCKRAAGPLQDLHLSFGPDPWMRGRVSIQEHLMFAKLGMTQEAEQVLGVLASQAEAADDDLLRILAAVCEGFHAFQSGEPDRAAFCYRQGLPLAIRLGHAEHEAGFHRRLALALQAAGDQEGARRARLQALSLTTPEINPDVQAHLLASEAEYLQRAGDMEQACAMSRRAAELTKRGTQYNTTMSVLHRVVVIGLFAEGEYPFHQQLDELEARARQQETASYRVTIHFVRGMLALAEGKTVRARELAHTASSACQAIIGMVDGAYSLGQVATLAVEAGDLELGQACLDRAIEAYTGEGWTRFFQDDPWVLRAKNGLQHTMREG